MSKIGNSVATTSAQNQVLVSPPPSRCKNRREATGKATQGTKNKDGFKNGVRALVKALHGEKIVVSGVTVRTEVDGKNKRWYHLVDAPPGSIIKVSGVNVAVISEKTLLGKVAPSEKIVGLGGVLLWDHLTRNEVSGAIMGQRDQ